MGIYLSTILSTTVALLRARWRMLLAITLITWAPSQIYSWLVHFELLPNIYAKLQNLLLNAPPDLRENGPVTFMTFRQLRSMFNHVVSNLAFGVFSAMGVAAVVVVSVAWANNYHLTIKALCQRTLQGILPVWGYFLISGLILDIGMLLFIIPYLYLSVIWYVAHFAAADERLWPIAAMRRSFELTRGMRWGVLCLVLGAFLISALAGAALTALFHSWVQGGFELEKVGTFYKSINTGWSFVWNYVVLIVTAAAYISLKEAHDGPSPKVIADAFD